MNGFRVALAVSAGALLWMTACSSSPTPSTQVTYENTIQHLTAKLCRACHGPKSPSLADFNKDKRGYTVKYLGPRMDTYDTLMIFVNGPDTGALMRRLDDGTHTEDGKPGNMYKNLGDNPTERAANLAIFKSWVGGWTLKQSDQISPTEREAIRAPWR
jgi:hypothetical protein